MGSGSQQAESAEPARDRVGTLISDELGRPVLARSLEVATVRAAAIPPAGALPVADTSSRGVTLAIPVRKRKSVSARRGAAQLRFAQEQVGMGSLARTRCG
jgi:hypothetical protein